MYPRIGNITGYMAYVGFWLKHLPDFREMDNNSGLPPKDWVESVKSAVTTLSGSIEGKRAFTFVQMFTKYPFTFYYRFCLFQRHHYDSEYGSESERFPVFMLHFKR